MIFKIYVYQTMSILSVSAWETRVHRNKTGNGNKENIIFNTTWCNRRHSQGSPRKRPFTKKTKSLLITVTSQAAVQWSEPTVHFIITLLGNQTFSWCRHIFLAKSKVLTRLSFVITDCFILTLLVPTWINMLLKLVALCALILPAWCQKLCPWENSK